MKIEFLTKNKYIDYDFQNVAPNQVWNVMSQCEGFEHIYWHEIFPIFIKCVSHVSDLEFPKYIHSQEHIQKYFLDFGFDFNHLDCGGNSFLKYYLSTNRRDRGFQKLILTHSPQKLIDLFSTLMKEDIFYHKNKFGETILFDLLHPADTGLNGEHFKEVLDKYPKFKEHLHDKNNLNFNLLNKALNESNLFIIPFFLEEKLDFTHKFVYQIYGNKNPVFEKNILDQFIFFAPRDEALDYFNFFIQHVDIMEKTSVQSIRDNFFNTCLDWMISDKVHQETRNKSSAWLRVISKNIINEKAFIGKYTLQQIHYTLNDYIFKHMDKLDDKTALSLINLFTYTEGALDFHKNKQSSVKMKI